jgi:bifunctional DNA-binding transcriptional regulator/antitoxin component of YhaV-PrlF toxin-antitoxin module
MAENITHKKQMLGVPVNVLADGTIKLPDDMLEFAGVLKGGTVEIFADRDGIFIRTADIICDFCGINGNMGKLGEKNICNRCLAELNEKVQGMKYIHE